MNDKINEWIQNIKKIYIYWWLLHLPVAIDPRWRTVMRSSRCRGCPATHGKYFHSVGYPFWLVFFFCFVLFYVCLLLLLLSAEDFCCSYSLYITTDASNIRMIFEPWNNSRVSEVLILLKKLFHSTQELCCTAPKM